jgi:hypothetical protein
LDELGASERARPFDGDIEHAIDVQTAQMRGVSRTPVSPTAPDKPMGVSHR